MNPNLPMLANNCLPVDESLHPGISLLTLITWGRILCLIEKKENAERVKPLK